MILYSDIFTAHFFGESNQLSLTKHGYIIHNLSDKAIKGTVGNRQCHCTSKGLLEITFSVFLQYFVYTDFVFFPQAVAEANKAYVNSKIPLRMTIFCIEPIDIK